MNKKEFIEDLKDALEDEDVSNGLINEIIQEYSSMIDDALESGETIDSFIKRMGSSKKVARSVAKNHSNQDNRLVAVTPFIATIVFFIIGTLWNAWNPAWLVFLLIPMMSFITSARVRWLPLSFFIILILVVLGSTYLDAFVPLWALFLLPIAIGKKQKSRIRPFAIMYTILTVSLYITVTFLARYNILVSDQPVMTELIRTLPFILLIPIVGYAFSNGAIRISVDSDFNVQQLLKKPSGAIVFTLLLATYLVLGFTFNLWHPGWLVFLLFPMYFIISESKKLSLLSLSPFLATALFVLIGEYVTLPNQGSGYTLSWLVFLMIPVIGIITKERGTK
jgi:nucleoid DNA-binding protein